MTPPAQSEGRERCNCATFGSAARCPFHSQADYDAAKRERLDGEGREGREWTLYRDVVGERVGQWRVAFDTAHAGALQRSAADDETREVVVVVPKADASHVNCVDRDSHYETYYRMRERAETAEQDRDSLSAENDQLREALKAVAAYSQPPHPHEGCGVDACVGCLIESTAKGALASLPAAGQEAGG